MATDTSVTSAVAALGGGGIFGVVTSHAVPEILSEVVISCRGSAPR